MGKKPLTKTNVAIGIRRLLLTVRAHKLRTAFACEPRQLVVHGMQVPRCKENDLRNSTKFRVPLAVSPRVWEVYGRRAYFGERR